MRQTYTRTFFSSRLADGFCGLSRTLTAMAAATAKATDVKKPKTFCTRTRVECMMDAVLLQLALNNPTKSPSPKEVTDLGEAVLKGLALMNLLPE